MTGMRHLVWRYFDELAELPLRIVTTRQDGSDIETPQAIDETVESVKSTVRRDGKIMFIGNGGSAGIASHMAIDFSKNGGFPALAFNDAASLTCLANDLGYDNVFAHQVRTLARPEDLLFAISSSGRSANILEAVRTAKDKEIKVVTLSGFAPYNPLRAMGEINFHVPNGEYGFVEITHLALCHAILDLAMGWRARAAR